MADRLQQEYKSSAGFSLVEVLLAAVVLSIIVTSLAAAVYYGQDSSRAAGERARAAVLAEEMLEAARNIRDANPTDPFNLLPNGTHGLAVAGNQWTLSGTQDSVDIFSRQLVIATINDNTRLLTANVSWNQSPQRLNESVTLTTYLTKWLTEVVAAFGDWDVGIFKNSCLDLAGTNDGWKVQVAGNYAYIIRVGGTPSFAIADISNPAAPVLSGSLSLAGIPASIAVAGDYAYIASQNNAQELQVINIAVPTAPVQVGSFNATGNQDGRGIYVVGQTVYLARASGSGQDLVVIDVTSPNSPSQLGTFSLGTNSNEVYVSGNYAYVASADDAQEIKAIDISNPASMSIDGFIDLAGVDDALTIGGWANTVTVGQVSGAVWLVDITNPLSLSLINSTAYDQGGQVNDLSLDASNEHLFLASSEPTAEFQVADIINPASPTLLGAYNEPANNFFWGVAYDPLRDRAVVASADNTGELCILGPDVPGDWSTPILTGALNMAGTHDGWKVQTAGNYAYAVRNLVGANPDFVVIDISDPVSPLPVGSLNLTNEPQNIAISGNFAYIASNNTSQELQIINISNPAAPSQASSYNAPGTLAGFGVYAVGSRVYLTRDSATTVNELDIINATNPAAPVSLGSLNLTDDANEVVVLGNYAYVASDSNTQELQIINISNPASLAINATINLSGAANAETVAGANNLVLVGRADGLMHVIDVTNPLAPVLQSTFNAQGAVRDIDLGSSNTLAFVGNDFNNMELQIFDLTAPATPLLKSFINTLPDSDLNGVAYNPILDVAVAVGEDDSAEFIVIVP